MPLRGKLLTREQFAALWADMPWKAMLSTGGLFLGVLVCLQLLLRSIQQHAGANPRPLADEFYSMVLYGFACAVIIFSMWGSAALKEALQRGMDAAPRGSIQHWVIYGACAMLAVIALAAVQGLSQDIGKVFDAVRANGDPWYKIYDALRAFLAVWGLVVAYKCKIFWDAGIQAVHRPRTARSAGETA